MNDKAKRKREWGSHEKRKKLPEQEVVAPGSKHGEVIGIGSDPALGSVIDWLYQYTRDMHSWGQDVRDDIIRLEGRVGFATGDPGDPPDGPPEP